MSAGTASVVNPPAELRPSAVAKLAPRRVLLALVLLALDLLLFVPSYVFSQPHADFLPFAAVVASGRDLYHVVLGFALGRANQDIFRVSFDWTVLLVVLMCTARNRARGLLRGVAVAAYLCLLLFLVYHHGISYFYVRTPALGEDWRLAINLLHFVQAMWSWKLLVQLLAGVLAWLLVGVAAAWALRGLQTQAAAWSWRRKLVVGLGLLLPMAASLAWFGAGNAEPLVQCGSQHILDNWRASRAEARRMAPLRAARIDRRYDAFAKLSLKRKPDFYLLMIEAYGEILATWDMTDGYRGVLGHAEQRLTAAGYHAATAYSAAPVFGGTSWFSIASVHTGIMIDRPVSYAALEHTSDRVPSITRFFAAQGYRTYALEPGSTDKSGLARFDLFGHDEMLDASAIDYRGPRYGWGRIPDQFSLRVLRDRALSHAPEPHYVFYMSVSTHYPWGQDVPPYVADCQALQRGQVLPAAADPHWPAPDERGIGTALRRSYLRSVDYEWRVLTELLEAESSPDVVVVIVGDHQPRLESNPPGEVTLNAPVHILSRDAAFVASFADAGFQPGLFADPTLHPPLQHEGLFSLCVSKLSAAYGAAGSNVAAYFPDGVGLAGLNR